MANIFQCILLPFLVFCVIYHLIEFKNYFFNIETDAIFSEVKVCLSVFLTKFCICYDQNLEHPWRDGAFAGMENKYVIPLTIVLSINTVISYWLFNFDSDWVSLTCLLAICLFEFWLSKLGYIAFTELQSRLKAWGDRVHFYPNKLIEVKVKNIEFPKSVGLYYKELFNKELEVQLDSCGAQFECSFTNAYEDSDKNSNSDLEFKIIDVKEYVKYRFGSLTEKEESETVLKFNRDFKFLTQISHPNIARIIRADKFFTKNGVIKHLVLVTKEASYNLNGLFINEFPNGVGHHCARFWLKQVVDAVHYLHCQLNKDQPIAHMNIKPETICFYATKEHNKGYDAKLSDCVLDIYFPRSGQILTQENKYLISAPEYFVGRKKIKFQGTYEKRNVDSLAADIFSLGIILVLLIKGKIENVVKLPKDIDSEGVIEPQTADEALYVDFTWKYSKDSVRKLFIKKESRHLNHLLKGMLERKPESRYDIICVKDHPWFETKQTDES